MNNSKLMGFRKKTITIDELKALGYEREEILDSVSSGVFIPMMKSGTDGNLRAPLYQKYRIVSEKKDTSELLDQMKALHPKLLANGYLRKKPELYQKYRKELNAVSAFLQTDSSNCYLSRRERSYQIFGDEKFLDHTMSTMQAIGLSEDDFKCYATPEQCFSDYIPMRKKQMTLLICENKDIWFNIRRLMSEENCFEFFGVHLDGVIYGQGNDITGKQKFSSYVHFLSTGKITFLYCGDIDRAGFDIFYRLCREAINLDISLFVPIYQKMLELSDISLLPQSEDERGLVVEMEALSELFSKTEIEQIKAVLNAGKRLPQEVIHYGVLKENAR